MPEQKHPRKDANDVVDEFRFLKVGKVYLPSAERPGSCSTSHDFSDPDFSYPVEHRRKELNSLVSHIRQ